MTEMTPEVAKILRDKFPDEAIGTLPKPTRRDAQKGNCAVCGGYHGLPAVHLDYVGHAAATDRLLQADPCWTWEAFALGDDGLPALDHEGNLWIRLTVAGVTRPGVGDGASIKEKIGDAIRNAAMRFGVALDLWSKEDLHTMQNPSEDPQEPAAGRDSSASRRAETRSAPASHSRPESTPGESDPVKVVMSTFAGLESETRTRAISAAKEEGITIGNRMSADDALVVHGIIQRITNDQGDQS